MIEYIKKAWSGLDQEDRIVIFDFHKSKLDGIGSVGVDILTGAVLLEVRKVMTHKNVDLIAVRARVAGFLDSIISAENKSIDANQLKVDWSFWT